MYQIVSELGRGAMGIVYKGHDPNIDRFVAIKTISLHTRDDFSEQLEARFKIEAQAAGRLTHPNIISIYEFGEDAGSAFIAMEYVEGYSLSELIKSGKQLGISDILHIMQKVLAALQYAHDKGVVHRDIKPSNIMYTHDGEVKIADFGIARLESSTRTQVGAVLGTPGYMSPEQIQGQRVDNRSDLFSSGILLYELLTGERAFASSNIPSTTYKLVHTELPPPSKLCPTVPQAFDLVVAAALAKQPDNRFQSAREFLTALNSIQTDRTSPAVDQFNPTQADGKTTIHRPENPTSSAASPTVQAPATWPGIDNNVDSADEVIAKPIPSRTEPRPLPASHSAAKGAKAAKGSVSGYWKIAGAGLVLLGLAVSIPFMLKLRDNVGSDKLAEAQLESVTIEPITAPEVSMRPEPYPPGTTFSDCDTCPTMMVIPPGSFLQGSSGSEPGREMSEGSKHKVSIAYPLAVGVFEVTRGQFSRFASEVGYTTDSCWVYDNGWGKESARDWLSPGFAQNDDHPVTCVSWEDAQAYVSWLSGKTGRSYRLLSESEWEYVARSGSAAARSWGDNPAFACQSANVADYAAEKNYPGWKIHGCDDRYTYTAPVGKFEVNGFGISDTMGNVFEWVADCWNDNYKAAPADGSAWLDGECGKRVLRGGSWYSRPNFVRSAYRNRFPPDHRSSSFGFRVASKMKTG